MSAIGASPFIGRLQLDFGDWGGRVGRIAVTLNPITWTRYGYTLPAGFMSDGASTPRPLWWFLPPWGDRSTIAALFHDWLCERLLEGRPLRGAERRADCDRLFRECLVDLGVAEWRAWAAWGGVRAYSKVMVDWRAGERLRGLLDRLRGRP